MSRPCLSGETPKSGQIEVGPTASSTGVRASYDAETIAHLQKGVVAPFPFFELRT